MQCFGRCPHCGFKSLVKDEYHCQGYYCLLCARRFKANGYRWISEERQKRRFEIIAPVMLVEVKRGRPVH